MYITFLYWNGSNPYIATTRENFFKMHCKYICDQIGENTYFVNGYAGHDGRITYKDKHNALLYIALEWSRKRSENNYTRREKEEWLGFFKEYGRKYGTLRDLRTLGII